MFAAFLARIADPAPGFVLRNWDPPPAPQQFGVPTGHRAHPPPGPVGRALLERMAPGEPGAALRALLSLHDGIAFASHHHHERGAGQPLVEILPVEAWSGVADRLAPGGDRAWVIDHNASRGVPPLYREASRWLPFAEVDGGDAWLTLFLDGPFAGGVFFLAPEPGFGIARPIAKDLGALLAAFAKDPAKLLRRLRIQVGVGFPDGGSLSFVPEAYVSDRRADPRFEEPGPLG